MEVREGYKQTEMGVIPEDWKAMPLGALATFLSGGTPSRSNEDYWMGDIPWISAKSLRCFYIYRSKSNVTIEAVAAGSKFAPIGSTLLLVRGSALHKEILSGLVTAKICFNQDVKALVPSPKINPKYLTFVTRGKANDLLKLVSSAGNTAGVLDTNLLKAFLIPFPPAKAEQEAIAEALSDADALIESLEQLIAKKRQIKQGAMQELLTGKNRLPGFSGEWEIKTFGEIFFYLSTATNSRSDLEQEGQTFYIHYGDIHTKFHGHLDFKKVSPPKIFRSKCTNAALIKNGDWIMADASEDYAGVGKTIEISGLHDEDEAVAGLHTFLLREKVPTYAPGFKGHLGGLKSLHEQYLRVATGMKVYGVSKTALIDLELPVPPFPEQTAIAEILSDMDAEIVALEGKLSKARQVKQGMMQELLTGNIRLVEPEAATTSATADE